VLETLESCTDQCAAMMKKLQASLPKVVHPARTVKLLIWFGFYSMKPGCDHFNNKGM
jgi:hypothetical protein